MFQIRLLPAAEVGPDGQRLGEIRIDDFIETFCCSTIDARVDLLESYWRTELAKLLNGELAVALPFDPRFAWIVYRDGDDCYVQQKMFFEGNIKELPPRTLTNDEGELVSEWAVSLESIRHFLISDCI